MGRYVTEHWPQGAVDGERYEAFVPHPIEGWRPELSRHAEYRLEAAEKDIADAVQRAERVPGYRWAIECLMLHSESLSSSAIEGVYSSLEGLVAHIDEQSTADRTALGNWEMLDAAVDIAHDYQPFTVDDVKELHHTLMSMSDNPQIAGRFRQGPGWVGQGQHRSLGPLAARYVPPPAYLIDSLMDDLVDAINYSDLPPVLKASLVHAQFETIHPFPDGNGRVGRALILISLGRSGATNGMPLPISHALLDNRQSYYNALLRYQRFTGDEDDPERSRDLEGVALLMADSAHLAAEQTRKVSAAIETTMGSWAGKLTASSNQSARWQVLEELVRTPVFTVEVMQEQTGIPAQTVYRCVKELKTCGIVSINGKLRNTVYTADDILLIADDILRVRSRSTDSKTSKKKRDQTSRRREPARSGATALGNLPSSAAESSRPHGQIAVRCAYKGPRSGKQCVMLAGHKGQHRYG